MVYLGRLVGIGWSKYERPCVVYAVSGRSDASKMRIAEIAEGEFPSVRIGPYGELTPEQEAQRDLIFYNAIKTNNGKGRVVISNGKQTDPIELMLQEFEKEKHDLDFHVAIAHGFVDQRGAEPDSYRTPRIAGIMDKDGRSALGIVTNAGLYTRTSSANIFGVPGVINYISTYAGDTKDKSKVVIHDSLKIPSGFITDTDFINAWKLASTPQKLADAVFDWMDRDFVVCSAAGGWNPDTERWNLAVRNLHNR